MNVNSRIVLDYLSSYFKNNKKPLTVFDINIAGLSIAEVENAFEELYESGYIILNDKYIYPSVEGLAK